MNYGFFAPLPVRPWLIRPLADSPLTLDDSLPVKYTGDSLLKLAGYQTK